MGIQERLDGPFGYVDAVAIVAPIDHVVEGSFILYAQTAGHVSIVGIPRSYYDFVNISRIDPFGRF
jgi:hypothetical protein